MSNSAVLIFNELIDSRLHQGILRLFEVVYKHVNWEFLVYVMRRMGFGERWISWIRQCISLAVFVVLVNSPPWSFSQLMQGIARET